MRDRGLTGRAVEQRFAPAPGSVGEARRFLTRTLADWDGEDLAWTAALLLSELATNAVLHAGSDGFSVALRLLEDGALRVELTDASVRPPRQRDYGTSATTGRGIALVDQLAREWGVAPRPGGKTVWCEVLPEPPAPGRRPRSDEQEADPAVDLDAFLSAEDAEGSPSDLVLRAAA